APCADDAQCKSGLTCLGLDKDDVHREGVCRKFGQKGQPCDDKSRPAFAPGHDECAAGLGCIDDACAPVRDDGAPCDRHAVCKSWHCRFDDKGGGVCAARSVKGGACNHNDDCAVGRCEKGKCVDRKPAGEACGDLGDCLGTCDQAKRVCISQCASG